MRKHFEVEQIQLFFGALCFLFKRILKATPHFCITRYILFKQIVQKTLRRRSFSHMYLTALFVSGEEDIDVKQLEMLFQCCIEKKRAVCWISSAQKNDAKRGKRIERDSRRVILSLTGIVQKMHVFKSRTQFHTAHFRRWYEYGNFQLPANANRTNTPLHTTPIGAAKTSVLHILPLEYSQDFERIYREYEGRFYKSPFIDTEHNTLVLRLDVACKTSTGELVAQHSFFQDGEPREQHILANRFAQDVTMWLYHLYS